MTLRHLLLSLMATGAFGLACGPTEETAAPYATDATEEQSAPLVSGRYDVRGVTTVRGAQEKRKIAGTVILVQQGDRYTATFELKTKYPAEGVPSDAEVIGVGEGRIEGSELRGSARTQVVVSSVPGVDTGFAFVPRHVSARIVSDSVATFHSDGTISIELENHPDEDQRYVATTTRLTGTRSADQGPTVARLE